MISLNLVFKPCPRRFCERVFGLLSVVEIVETCGFERLIPMIWDDEQMGCFHTWWDEELPFYPSMEN